MLKQAHSFPGCKDRELKVKAGSEGSPQNSHLLGLLHKGLPKEGPGDVLHNAAGLLKALVDGHSAHLQQVTDSSGISPEYRSFKLQSPP